MAEHSYTYHDDLTAQIEYEKLRQNRLLLEAFIKQNNNKSRMETFGGYVKIGVYLLGSLALIVCILFPSKFLQNSNWLPISALLAITGASSAWNRIKLTRQNLFK